MKTALVTGGTCRLGRIIAETLRARGWRVLTSSHRDDAPADLHADLADPTGAARLYAELLRLNGGRPPEALVNNAGLFAGEAETLRTVNFVSPQKLTMLMAGREAGLGAVVNVLDARVLAEAASGGAYAQSKRELLEFTRKAAAMFSATLRVNAVAPGPVLLGPATAAVHEPAGETPLGRPTPEAAAEAVAFLLEAPYTTGAVIPVDGGQWLG